MHKKKKKRIKKQIEKEGKTKLVNSMTKFTNVLDKLHIKIKDKVFKDIHNALGGHLRLLISAAAPIDSQILEGLLGFGIRTVQGYGLTEAAPTVSIENDFDVRLGSVGKPIKNVEIKIEGRDEQGIGEVLIKGPNVMLGYYKNEEATKEVLVDGWYHTGDLGYLDKDGFLYITGRKKNVIVQKNGKNIFPEELEELLNKIDLVKESMVFGMPKGDDVVVSVKVQYDEEIAKEKYNNKSIEELQSIVWEKIKEVNKTLPTYKYVKHLLITKDDFIKTTTAKIKRFEEFNKIMANQH